MAFSRFSRTVQAIDENPTVYRPIPSSIQNIYPPIVLYYTTALVGYINVRDATIAYDVMNYGYSPDTGLID